MSQQQQYILERVQQYGIEQLTDAELLILVLRNRSAAKQEKVLKQVQSLIAERGGVADILRMDVGELLQHEFDAELSVRIQALMELARRLMRPAEKGYQVKSSDDVALLVGPDMRYLDHEEMRVLLLDTKNYVVANLCMYKGTIDSTVLRVAEIFRHAITRQCQHVVICHNHPTGDPSPSPEDQKLTQQCVEAAKLLDIELLDHIIIGNPHYVSLKRIMQW